MGNLLVAIVEPTARRRARIPSSSRQFAISHGFANAIADAATT